MKNPSTYQELTDFVINSEEILHSQWGFSQIHNIDNNANIGIYYVKTKNIQ